MATTVNLTASLEDYMEAIFHLVDEKQAARARDIAQRLQVNRSSVTGALQSLAQKGLVNYEPYEAITLTQKGVAVAKDVVRRHEVLRDFLVKVFGTGGGKQGAGRARIPLGFFAVNGDTDIANDTWELTKKNVMAIVFTNVKGG